MKKDIHPKYYSKAKVKCACGASFAFGSTQELTEIEICSKCHPFYTGKEKIVDVMGRVERYKKQLAQKEKLAKKGGKGKKAKQAERKTKKQKK